MTSSWLDVQSPIGPLRLWSDGVGINAIEFSPFRQLPADARVAQAHAPAMLTPALASAQEQLADYFAGRRRDFDLPLAPAGTQFRQRVWAALRQVPYAQTVSYCEIARRLGLPPGASRAVGSANGANPIPIVVPCHRVVGSDGSLTGYAGGMGRKRLLLDLESAAAKPALF